MLDLPREPTDAVECAALLVGLRRIKRVGHVVEQPRGRRTDRRRPVPVDVPLPPHIEDRDVIPHDLETYDDDDE